jgi:hypothetical protein
MGIARKVGCRAMQALTLLHGRQLGADKLTAPRAAATRHRDSGRGPSPMPRPHDDDRTTTTVL